MCLQLHRHVIVSQSEVTLIYAQIVNILHFIFLRTESRSPRIVYGNKVCNL